MTIFNIIVVLSWAVFLFYWGISAVGIKTEVQTSAGREQLWLRLVAAIAILLVLHSQFAQELFARHPKLLHASLGMEMWGAFFTVIGIAFAISARRSLGKNWGMPRSEKEKPELVMSGPYAYVRHPIYSGVLLAILGSTLSGGLFWLIAFIIAGIYFIYSARKEEKIMLRNFPDAYAEYVKRTKLIIPFIY